MISRIQNCYDSHTHFLATGQVAAELQLHSMKSAEDVKHLVLKPEYYRADWLTGFGWDHNKWVGAVLPTKKDLDLVFPDVPVIFSRIDGHSSWVNTKALEKFKLSGVQFDENGILFEQDHVKALSLLPAYTNQQLQLFFNASQKIFNQGGFTHIRDLSMNLNQWKILCEMSSQNRLNLCVDCFVTAENVQDLGRVIQEISEMRKNPSKFLKVHGVKIFVDGSLGSKTAYLSAPYLGSQNQGLFLWSSEDIKTVLRKTWQQGFDVAVHTIGDLAAHNVVQAAREISAEGVLGRLHLEHVEILRPETIQLMKPLHVTCYLQPSHWSSDQAWLSQILPEALQKNIFQWELLRKNKIPFHFGSDSPIEKPFLLSTPKALKASSFQGVPALNEDWKKYHTHPDPGWTNSWTEFDTEKIVQVYFNEKPLL